MASFSLTSAYVPGERITREQLLKQGIISLSSYSNLKKNGCNFIPTETKLTGLEMIYQVFDRLFADFSGDQSHIRYLVMVNRTISIPYSVDVYGAIRRRYALDNAIGFTVKDLACASFFMGLSVCESILKFKNTFEDSVILFSVEKEPSLFSRNGEDLFLSGDAGVAMLLTNNHEFNQILAINVMEEQSLFPTEEINTDTEFTMNTNSFLTLAKLVKKTIKDAKINMEEINLVIPSNSLRETWLKLAFILGFPKEKLFMDGFQAYGHLSNCDVVLNYRIAYDKGFVRSGDLLLLISTGEGGGSGCAVVRKM